MLSKNYSTLLALFLLALSDSAFGRPRWLERDGRAVQLYPRRFGQEHPPVIDKLAAACPGAVCGNLSGGAITPLLAAQPECSQQDFADSIIDAAQQFDNTTKANMIQLAIEYRQAEKNTPPDFTTNPPTNRNSVFCQTAPKNSELNGLVQAQDPANDPDIFFDPATQASVKKGAQANTFPFGTSNATISSASPAASGVASATQAAVNLDVVASVSEPVCPVTVTITFTGTPVPTIPGAVTITAGGAASTTATAPVASSTASSSAIGNFGSCSIPQIEFGVGFDNRKETSFEPVDKTSYNHGSADNIDIITQFMCDQLVNSCGANQVAQQTCANAQAAADTQPPKTGGQADAFNAVFGITTHFAQITPIDDQGNPVTVSVSAASTAIASATSVVIATTSSATVVATAAATQSTTTISSTTVASSASATASSSGIGNFGKCSIPKIDFGVGFDGRKETSFEPDDKTSYNHGSADGIDVITQFMCDALVNTCGADQTAQATCAKAKTAADGQAAGTGAQADAFNAEFGITTNFAAVAEVNNQGNVVSSGNGEVAVAASSPAGASTSATAASATSAAAASSGSGGNLQTFTGALGGINPPPVTALGNGQFQVQGNSAFNSLSDALGRSCDVQHNQCANAANASGNAGSLTVTACGNQQTQCNAAHQ